MSGRSLRNGTWKKSSSRVSRNLEYTAPGAILAMAPAQNQAKLAVAGKDFLKVLSVNHLNVFEKEDLLAQSRTEADLQNITDLQWSRISHDRLAVSTASGEILIYLTDTSRRNGLIEKVAVFKRPVHTLAYSSTLLVAGDSEGLLRAWDVRRKSSSTSMKGDGSAVREAKFSHSDDHKLAAIYDNGVVRVWDIRMNKEPLKKFHAYTEPGLSLDWHPCAADLIVTGGRSRRIILWNLESENKGPEHDIWAPDPVLKVRFCPSDTNKQTRVASSSMSYRDHKIYVWDPNRPWVPDYVISSHEATVSDLHWCSDTLLWSAAKDGKFKQHDMNSQQSFVSSLPCNILDWSAGNKFTFVHQFAASSSSSSTTSSLASLRPITNNPASPPALSPPPPSPLSSAASVPPDTTCTTSNNTKSHVLRTPTLCTVLLPSLNMDSFDFLAQAYRYPTKSDSSLTDLLATVTHNDVVAAQAGIARTSQTWKVLGQALSSSLDRWRSEQAAYRRKSSGRSRGDSMAVASASDKSVTETSAASRPRPLPARLSSRLADSERYLDITSRSLVGTSQIGPKSLKSTLSALQNPSSPRSSPTMTPQLTADAATGTPEILTLTPQKEAREEFNEFLLSTAGKPWGFSQLLSKALLFSTETGDIQMTVILYLTFRPFCIKELSVNFEDAIANYISLLRRRRLHVEATEIILASGQDSVRAPASTGVLFEPICPHCSSSLNESNAVDSSNLHNHGFWYCAKCKSIVDKCALCTQIIRKSGVKIMECGHRLHNKCMEKWSATNILDCPSGCGNPISVKTT